MKENFLIFFNTKNTYGMVEKWVENNNYDQPVLNIDIGSEKENREKGIEICRKKEIHFIDSKSPAMSATMHEAAKYAKMLNLK